MRRTDPLILGGGPAGAASAITLAQGGATVRLLEATRETGDALCGGFLSWRTLQTVRALGVEPQELGGHPVSKIRLLSGNRLAEAPLPAGAIGLSRRRLDTMLLSRAEALGVGIERGVKASALEEDRLILKDGAAISTESLFIATGKHELRGLGRSQSPSPTLGLRVRLAPHPALSRAVDDAIELHLFEGGYAGLILQEDGSANLCMALDKGRLGGAGGDAASFIKMLGELHPRLGDRLSHMEMKPQIDAIGSVPYGWITSETRAGLFRLGDQAACIPSLAGEGIGLALASGERAARAWLADGAEAAPTYQHQFASAVRRPVTMARLLWHWAERPLLSPAMIGSVRLVPSLARLAATLTRIGH